MIFCDLSTIDSMDDPMGTSLKLFYYQAQLFLPRVLACITQFSYTLGSTLGTVGVGPNDQSLKGT